MRFKKISLMTISALYAGGVAATAMVNSSPLEYEKASADPFSLTVEQYQEMQRHSQNLMNREGITSQPNVHLNKSVGKSEKVPFHFENNLSGEQTYIVRLTDSPVATYQGDVSGFGATAPTSAKNATDKLDLNARTSRSYAQYIEQQQGKALNGINALLGQQNDISQSYKYAFNGFSLKLTQAQASRVAKMQGVSAVTRATVQQLQTDVGPAHIGADRIWSGEASQNTKFTGAGIVVGILDTGINSNHPSFSAQGDDGVAIVNPLGEGNYIGDCQTEEFSMMCNHKLIGVRSYTEITDTYGDPVFKNQGWWAAWDRARPANGEDYNGHGSHTASTVAGNILYDVPYQMSEHGTGEEITGRDTDLVFAQVSGVAPHANIVSYQVCWAGGQGDPYAGCPEEVTLKAIDDAIADGVDVINFSVGGQESFPWTSPVELAFLAAREAGISVAASAGNAGYSWMDHVSPWLTSVAATKHGRILDALPKRLEAFEGGDTLPTTGSYSAESITGAYTGPVVLAEHYDVNNANCDMPFAEGTFALLPNGDALAEAPIVVCGRSDQPRVAKADNVKIGGAGGFILYNTQSDYLYGDSTVQKVSDYYSLPSAHVGNYDGGRIKSWLESGTGHRVTITDGSLFKGKEDVDMLADFSSRGPSTTNPDVMAPTLSAPGVDVFAAYANDRLFTLDNFGMNWAMISGTSMASPHVAGSMALLKNAHPGWTAAEIQSALTTTTTPSYVYGGFNEKVKASFDDSGAGVINVANAVQATLVMDETIENYQNANPLNGGTVSDLNTPYLVNRACEGTCSWFRTFTAAESGSWSVSAEEIGYEGASLMSLEFSPSQFSLAAGETQRILVSATLPDVDYQSDSPLGAENTNGATFNGKLMLTPSNADKPVQTLPIIAKMKKRNFPVLIEATIGRNQGEMFSGPVVLDNSSSINANVYGIVTGEQKEYRLRKVVQFPWELVNALPAEGSELGYRMFEVPAGTKRLVVEISKEEDLARFASRIDLGRDVNADGLITWQEEAICISDWRKRDYCAINNPEPGQYWYVVSNMKRTIGWWDPYDADHEIVTNITIISDEVTERFSVSNTESDGITATELSLNWNTPEAQEGDILHGLIELGSDSQNADIGLIPVRLERGLDDVTLTSSHTGAKVGDVVEFELVHEANLYGGDRELNIAINLPDGLMLDPSTVRGNEMAESMISVSGNALSIAGQQSSSKDAPRTYEFTTSLDDEMCRLPFSDYPEYVPLDEIGVQPLPGFDNEYAQTFEIPDFVGYDNYFPHIPLYGVEAKDTTNIITISGNGIFRFDAHALFSLPGYTFALDGLRDLVVAPFWRDNSVTLNESGMDFATFTPYSRGLYAAALNNGKYLAVQWKEMFNTVAGSGPWGGMEVDRSQSFSFQALASSAIDFKPGVYEMFFSYKELGSDKGMHSIGLKGYQGERGFFYPVNGYHYDEFAINEPEKFDSNMIVCGNYQGPESTRIVTRFSAVVTASAAASNQVVEMMAEVTNGDTVMQTIGLDVSSNILVSDMSDMTIDENATSSAVNVEYIHKNNRSVELQVSAANASATIEGMRFTLTPEANWHGDTEVVVTVMDAANSNDQTSTSFMLSVTSDNIELGCTDSSATNYDSNANQDDASCIYPAEPEEKSSGGSFGWLLIFLPLLMARRNQR